MNENEITNEQLPIVEQETQLETVQTVQKTATAKPTVKNSRSDEAFIEVTQDPEDGTWHWCLWSGNGRAMAISANGHTRRNDAVGNARAASKVMKEGMQILCTIKK